MLGGLSPRARFAAAALALAASTACASAQVPATTPAPAPAPAASDSTPAWLVADDAAKTVALALLVTPGPNGALINGDRAGGLQIVVPLGWTVQWVWRSSDSTAPHSLVAMEEREKLPTEGGRAVFTNAMTRTLKDGLTAGQVDRSTFTADQAGWFWLLCGVPGHALGGEYIGLRVDPEARTAAIKRK
jgi:hypothetical protein